ncbi:MAG: nucleotidyl transferase AbiEii/AbiGii toxin family protein [Acetobacteraceae bacterium]
MTLKPLKDPSASIRRRLLNHARAHGDDYQRVLTRYAIERLLFRVGCTDARDRYVLKGAMLFVTWPEHAFRPTGDLDFLGIGDPSPKATTELFVRTCQVPEPADGITFDAATLQVEPVREEEEYQGIRLTLKGRLGTAIVPVQVDIGFGDVVYPAPSRKNFPGLLPDLPAAEVLMYPPETVIAEKFEAMIRFGETNGRIKDFHDIWVTTRIFPFDLAILTEAVGGTLRRRRTAIPVEMPLALTPWFAGMPDTQGLWTGFLRRNPPTLPPPPFSELLRELRWFFGPVLAALAVPEAGMGRWNPDRGVWEQV